MKTAFVMPKIGAWVTHGTHLAPNQFYAQLAAYLREKKVSDVIAIDVRTEKLSLEQGVEKLRGLKPDVVVLGDILHSTGGLAIIWYFNETARMIKEALPGVKIVVGGIWYSAYGKETLEQHPYIDFVIMGEAELTAVELLNAIKKGESDFSNIKGLISRKDGQIVFGPHRELINDLDSLPMPAYDLFQMSEYVGHTHWKPFVELFTSRGCPGGCSFCYQWSQYDPRSPKDFTSWRSHSGKRVAEELELLSKKYGVKMVMLQDDAFNVRREMVEETCNEIIKRGLDINWGILGRADDWTSQLDIIPLMKKAGMVIGLVGIEVASDEELKRLGKGITTAQVKETVDTLRKNDIMTVGTVMFGFEDDDERSIKERFNYADLVDPDIFVPMFMTPVPGSPLWKKQIKAGNIDPNNVDLRKWDFEHPIIPTKHLTIERLGELTSWSMREFFSKPGRVMRIMESNYHELAKLVFRDYLDNLSKFEDVATKGVTYV